MPVLAQSAANWIHGLYPTLRPDFNHPEAGQLVELQVVELQVVEPQGSESDESLRDGEPEFPCFRPPSDTSVAANCYVSRIIRGAMFQRNGVRVAAPKRAGTFLRTVPPFLRSPALLSAFVCARAVAAGPDRCTTSRR